MRLIRFRLLHSPERKFPVRQGKLQPLPRLWLNKKNDYLCREMEVPISPMHFARLILYSRKVPKSFSHNQTICMIFFTLSKVLVEVPVIL